MWPASVTSTALAMWRVDRTAHLTAFSCVLWAWDSATIALAGTQLFFHY